MFPFLCSSTEVEHLRPTARPPLHLPRKRGRTAEGDQMTASAVQNGDKRGRRRATIGAIESAFPTSSPARPGVGEEPKEGACASIGTSLLGKCCGKKGSYFWTLAYHPSLGRSPGMCIGVSRGLGRDGFPLGRKCFDGRKRPLGNNGLHRFGKSLGVLG